jgi:hypothetical protein
MNIANIIRSKGFLGVIVGLFAVSALMGTFGLGEFVGSRKAQFSYAWSQHYDQNFGGPLMDVHGMAGTVMKIDGNELIINGRDQREKIVLVDPLTTVQSFRQGPDAQIVRINDHIVVIGDPNAQGQIVAKFIRILP